MDASYTNNAELDWPAHYRRLASSARDPRLQAFYRQGTIAGDTPLGEVPFVALDFETTGLRLERDEIISIGLVPFDLQRIRLRESRYWLLKPRRGLTDTSVPFHGITHSELDGAPRLGELLGDLLAAMAGQVVVAHCRQIERGFLDASLRRLLGEGIAFPVVDTMALEGLLYRRGLLPQLKRLFGIRPVSIRLAESRSRYNLPHYGQHHALTDAVATAELLQAQIRHRYDAQTPLSEICY
ncbi:3'-5' exonuclease [Granulosicoccaceae sp. 1_MG-2023]|nr:3'-5' exonuclease [Granulosicoccaceae sp. 1_MG-2023]